MIGVAIKEIIVNDATLAALVGDKVYPVVFPSNPDFPCITYRVISGYHAPVRDEEVLESRVQLDVWTYEYLDTQEIASALESLFWRYDGTSYSAYIHDIKVDLTFDTFEQNIKAHRAVVDLRVTHEGT